MDNNEEVKIQNKAEELVMLMGYKYARIFCIEMNIEYINFPNPERAEFWKEVSKRIPESLSE